MWLIIGVLSLLGHSMGRRELKVPSFDLRESPYLYETYERFEKRVIASFHKGIYMREVWIPVDGWEDDYEDNEEKSRICRRSKSFSTGTIQWLEEMLMKNCSIPSVEDLDERVLFMEVAFNRIESHPLWRKTFGRFYDEDHEYTTHREWFLQRAAKTKEEEAKAMAASIESLFGKDLKQITAQLKEFVKAMPLEPRMPKPEDIEKPKPTQCLIDGFLANNEFEPEKAYQVLSWFRKDIRSAARFASFCAQAEPSDPVAEKQYNDTADAIIRKANAWVDAKQSLLWPRMIRREAGKVFPATAIDESNYLEVLDKLTRRFLTFGAAGRGHAFLVFPSSYVASNWVSMISSVDPIDQKNASILLNDLHGVNLFVSRFQRDSRLPERFNWYDQSKNRGKIQQILNEHSDEDADVLLTRVTREIPDLIDPKLHFSSAILLKNRRPLFFLNSTIPHSVLGRGLPDHRRPFEYVHVESRGFTPTQVYLYLFP